MTVTKKFIGILLGLILLSACLEPEYDDIWSLNGIASINTIGYCRDVHIVDDIAYVAAGAAGVQGWDVSDITTINKVLNIDNSTVIYSSGTEFSFIYDRDIAQIYYSKSNQDLFVLENTQLVKCLNISDYDSIYTKGEILSVGTYEFRSAFDRLDTIRIFAADNDDGLKWHTYTPAFWGDWLQIDGTELPTLGSPVGIDMNNELIALGQGQQGIEIFTYNESNDNPISIGNFDTDGIASHPTFDGNNLYVALDFGGAAYFEISELPLDTTNSILTGYGYTFAEDLNVDHISIIDDIAILSLGPYGIALYDVSNPKKPVSKGIFDIGYTYKTVIHAGKVYVACREGLQIYEIHK